MPTTATWGLLFALLPLPALAQQAPRCYVGASATLFSFAPFGPDGATRVGPAVTLGLQLGRRWAVETGAQLAWRRETNDYTVAVPPSYIPQPLTITVHYTTLVVPLLARYTFTAPESRWRVDALGGVSWLHGTQRVQYTLAAPGQAPTDDAHFSSNTATVALGPQLRYALGSGLQVRLQVPFNLAVLGDSEGSFRERLLLNPQLGVQYTLAH